MDNSEKKEKYFSWEDILNEIRKNIGQIILFGIGGLVFVLLIMLFFITPKYTATTDILVSQKLITTLCSGMLNKLTFKQSILIKMF